MGRPALGGGVEEEEREGAEPGVEGWEGVWKGEED